MPEQFDLHQCTVPVAAHGQRLDSFLEGALPGISRSLVAKCIKTGHCSVLRPDGSPATKIKPSYALRGDERIDIAVPVIQPLTIEPGHGELDILFEDADVLVINKPAGMVVHPAIGHPSGTLLNRALGYGRAAPSPFEPSLIHRLDGDTSGVIALAKNRQALDYFQDQFRNRTTKKWYAALVRGSKIEDGQNTGWIGRHPKDFRKRAVVEAESAGAREALTRWQVLERYPDAGYSFLAIRILTGRTHQIRVHLSDARYPILADGLYGGSEQFPVTGQPRLQRQALHAWTLELALTGGQRQRFTAPLAADLQPLVQQAEFSSVIGEIML